MLMILFLKPPLRTGTKLHLPARGPSPIRVHSRSFAVRDFPVSVTALCRGAATLRRRRLHLPSGHSPFSIRLSSEMCSYSRTDIGAGVHLGQGSALVFSTSRAHDDRSLARGERALGGAHSGRRERGTAGAE